MLEKSSNRYKRVEEAGKEKHRRLIMGRKFGFSFSWRRALGISSAKGKISRAIGIPLTRQGRQRKAGRAMGCLVPIAAFLGAGAGVCGAAWWILS